ncbi:hypothetical protein ACO0QE_002070 [Hanseniaspora vineae]
MSQYESFIYNQQPVILNSSLSQLRYLILSQGLPTGKNNNRLRIHVWSVLLQCSMENCTSQYLALLSQGEDLPPLIFNKIKNDTPRTLVKDSTFQKTVPEDALLRGLCCFAWESIDIAATAAAAGIVEGNEDTHLSSFANSSGIHEDDREVLAEENIYKISEYVQGMNVLLAPLLFVCESSEPMAFRFFTKICRRYIPTYLNKNLSGVYKGAQLLEICLSIIDPKLSKFLRQDHLLTAEIYGIPSIMTLSACTPPLNEVLKLWDFMFAYGFHMNILFIVAQLVLMRSELLKSPTPMNLLKNFPQFNADEVIRLGVGFIAKLPHNVYQSLVEHLYRIT